MGVLAYGSSHGIGVTRPPRLRLIDYAGTPHQPRWKRDTPQRATAISKRNDDLLRYCAAIALLRNTSGPRRISAFWRNKLVKTKSPVQNIFVSYWLKLVGGTARLADKPRGEMTEDDFYAIYRFMTSVASTDPKKRSLRLYDVAIEMCIAQQEWVHACHFQYYRAAYLSSMALAACLDWTDHLNTQTDAGSISKLSVRVLNGEHQVVLDSLMAASRARQVVAQSYEYCIGLLRKRGIDPATHFQAKGFILMRESPELFLARERFEIQERFLFAMIMLLQFARESADLFLIDSSQTISEHVPRVLAQTDHLIQRMDWKGNERRQADVDATIQAYRDYFASA
jgi:hypothetical protein